MLRTGETCRVDGRYCYAYTDRNSVRCYVYAKTFTSSKARTRIRNVMGAFTDASATASGMVHYRTYCPLTADNVVYKVKMNFNL